MLKKKKKKSTINANFAPVVDSVALGNRPLEISDTMFQLVNTSCSFLQALHYCQNQFSSLTVRGQHEDENAMRQVLDQTQARRPVWVLDRNKLNPKPEHSLSKHGKSPEKV